MSANANSMSNLQTALVDFLGGGFSVQTKSGGFSTVLDPTTGTYKTTIATPGATVTAAGGGQSPVSLWQQLTTTASGNWVLIGLLAVLVILGVSFFKRKG